MKSFLKNTLFFFLAFGGLFLIAFYLGMFSLGQSNYYHLPQDTKHLVLGHSHSAYAYNDTLIEDLINLSNPGEAYFYTYLKAKILIPKNEQIELVFIEFSNTQITEEMNNWVWDDTYLPIRLPTYLPLMEYTQIKTLSDHNPKMFRSQLIKSMMRNISFSFEKLVRQENCLVNNMRFGGYSAETNSLVDSLLSSDSNLESKDLLGISELNLQYLEKTIQLCKTYKKQVVLIRTPIHQKSKVFDNEAEYQKIRKTRFRGTDFIDFRNFPLKNAQYFDLSHMNSSGAKVYSKWFNHLLKNGLSDSENKQLFVDEAMMTSY